MSPLLDEKTAAEYLGLSVRCLQNWRRTGKGPSFIRVSHKVVRYELEDIQIWLDKRRVSHRLCDVEVNGADSS